MAAKKAQSPTTYNRCAMKASGLKKLDPGLIKRLQDMRNGGVKCKVAGHVLGEIAELRREIKAMKGK